MLGVIATIVAAAKGRTGYAWFVGIWTITAWALALSGNSSTAIAPGALWLIIAIFMENRNKKTDNGRIIVYCPKCGWVGSDESGNKPSCPDCKTKLIATDISADKWNSMELSEKNELRISWGIAKGPAVPAEKPKDNGENPEVAEQPPKGFVCTNCNHAKAGWYKQCPFCGKLDSMQKYENHAQLAKIIGVPLMREKTPEPPKQTAVQKTEARPASPMKSSAEPLPEPTVKSTPVVRDVPVSALYCRKCGKQLPNDSLFCQYCGEKVAR